MRRSSLTATSAWLVYWTMLSVYATAAPPPPNLLARVGGLPCQVVMGRIVLAEHRGLAGRSDTVEDTITGRRETLCIQTTSGQSVVRYERNDAVETVAIDFLGQGDLRMRRALPGTTPITVHFVQPLRGPLKLEVTQGEQTRKYSAPTLWHLVLTEPKACHDHLLPLLEQLRPDWQLAARIEAIEQGLRSAGEVHVPLDRTELDRLIEQLASPKFAERQQANRQLEARGLSLLPDLEQLNREQLDAEQRCRLDELQAALIATTPDTPERVAAWLVADRKLWKQLAELSAANNR